ncbi:MAG: hypothetical protein NC293_13410 [Roseburia sp.]|nr:hypothetical protein [Roseburia sp.]
MKSVLGKLIQKEFGRNKYRIYCCKMDRRECMDVFCDIYHDLYCVSDDNLSDKLLNLLRTVQLSVKISQIFFYVTVGFAIAVLLLSLMPVIVEIKSIAIGVLVVMYFYKLAEYIRNRYCDRDVRIVLIYKTALFHVLSDEGK